jgi:transcriptional regulator with XRE-family HTH domain
MASLRFGDRMRALREDRGWDSRRAAARHLDVPEPYLRFIEGNKHLPSEDRLAALAKGYGVSIKKLTDWLVEDRLTELTGESTGVNWFMRSLDDLDEGRRRQALKVLLGRLAKRQERGDAWPDEYAVRRKRDPDS